MYAVAPGKVSFGSPTDVAENGGVVVVEAAGRNFGYWHVAPAVCPGVHVPLHGLLGHIATQPEDWGHVHLAESIHDPKGISYWNPLRPGALTPFVDHGPAAIDAIVTSLPAQSLHGLVDLSVKAHDTTPIAVSQPNPPGWLGLPVTPARIRWRLTRAAQPVVPWQVAFDHRTSLSPDIQGNPPSDANFAAARLRQQQARRRRLDARSRVQRHPRQSDHAPPRGQIHQHEPLKRGGAVGAIMVAAARRQ